MKHIRISKDQLSILMQKNNSKASIHFIAFFSLILLSFYLQIYFFEERNWSLFIIFTYISGVILSFSDQTAAAHEFQHNNVFTSRKINQFFYKFLMFYSLTNWVYNKLSHMNHHRYALVEDKDDEFPFEKLDLLSLFQLLTFNVNIFFRRIRILFINSLGNFPMTNTNKSSNKILRDEMKNCARLILLGHFFLIAFFYYNNNLYLYLIIILSQFFFNFFKDICVRAQHYGHNKDNVFEDTRSLETNKIIKFLYWNVNFHVEHHLYPSVPFYNLPKLRNLIGPKNILTRHGLINFFKILVKDNKKNFNLSFK
jgi:fatty acid desaturase